MRVRSIKQAKKIAGKKIFLRADFNVPLKNGKIQDDYKIISGLPTIRYLLRYNCRVIIGTHLGRPKAKKNLDYSVAPIAERLSKLLDRKVIFMEDCLGLRVGTQISKIKGGEIVFLENLRFYRGEEENNARFARQLASLADIYVNNAFGVSHRAHASVSAIKKYNPSYAGILLEKEIKSLERIVHPQKPLVVVIGGAKIKTKIPLIKKINKKAFKILIGGALASNFLAARGFEVGKSLIDRESVNFAKKFRAKNILLPLDLVVKKAGSEKIEVKNVSRIGSRDIIFDIGPNTVKFYSKFIKKAQTIAWNGPMGKFENKDFKYGTLSIARLLASRSSGRAFGVAGGGETVAALKMSGMMEYLDWVSTGGGAMLAYLGGEKMPGLKGLVKQ